jgi:pilus assembly protein Flp/PilA
MIARFLCDERGTTAIEYGLIAVLLSVAIIAAVSAVGTEISGMFGRVDTKVKAATGG